MPIDINQLNENDAEASEFVLGSDRGEEEAA